MASIRIAAPQRFAGPLRVVGDKSISHRALMFAAIADGATTVRGCNRGEDVAATMRALRAVGSRIEAGAESIDIAGVQAFHDPADTIDCGNSGTTMRVLAGLLAGQVNGQLDGDASLRRRPMERVAAPLRAMGAAIESVDGHAPLRLTRSAQPLRGIAYEMPVASAQVQTALLLAGLRADGVTAVTSPARTRDHSALMLRAMRADMDVDGLTTRVRRSRLCALESYEVPGDISAAAYFIAAATLLPGSRISLLDTGVNPTRAAVVDAMRDMGAHIGIRGLRERHGEPVADIEVVSATPLVNRTLDPAAIPALIDDIPLLCAVAACASGVCVIRGAAELRVKESDRIATTVALLRSFGVAVSELPDGMSVRGGRPLRPPAQIGTGGDHRIGMTAAVLAAAAHAAIVIDDADCIATSYPGFKEAWEAAFAS